MGRTDHQLSGGRQPAVLGAQTGLQPGAKTAGLTEVALIFAHELMHSSGDGGVFMLRKGGRNGKEWADRADKRP
ncbi:hypothetical protein TUM17560_21030 [Serratia marcescens]|jgi:hypothetical protein|nr:hypothetical protein TUM17560_21030 [Serratia marcescens]